MLDWIAHVPPALELLVLMAAAVTAVYTLKKFVYNPLKAHFDKVNAGMDTLLGYPPVLDPGSGRELKPATPPLATRVDTLEDALTTMINTQAKLVDLERDLATISVQLKNHQQAFEERKESTEVIIQDFFEWRAEQDQLAKIIRERLEIDDL